MNESVRQPPGLRVTPGLLLLFLLVATGALLGLLLLTRESILAAPLAVIVALMAVGVVLLLLRLRSGVTYLLALLMLSVTFQGDNFGVSLKPDAVMVPLLGLLLLLRAPRRYLMPRSYPFLLPALGFLGANFAASLLNSPVPATSLIQSAILAARVVTFFLVVMAVQHEPDLRGRLPLYFIAIMLAHTFASMIAVALYKFVPTPLVNYNQDGKGSLSVNGFFLEPNLYGVFTLCVLGIIIGMALYASKRRLLLLGVAGIVGLVGLVLGYTRSTWLGLGLMIAVLAVVVIIRGSKRAFARYSVLLTVLGSVVVVLLLFLIALSLAGFEIGLLTRIQQIVDARSDSAAVRTMVWDLAFSEWSDHPWLGNGPLSFPYIDGWLFSSVMQTLHDSGIVGLVFMLWICLGAMLYTWYGYYRAVEPLDRGVLLGYLLAQIGLFFTSQFSSFFWGGFTWVLLGLAVGHSGLVIRQWKKGCHARLDAAPSA